MIVFEEDEEEYWFDPEEAKTNYKGDNPAIVSTLENIQSVASIEEPTDNIDALDYIGPSKSVYSPEKAREVVITLLETREEVSIIEDWDVSEIYILINIALLAILSVAHTRHQTGVAWSGREAEPLGRRHSRLVFSQTVSQHMKSITGYYNTYTSV